MKNLQLPLKKQWFEMTKAGIKTEDYREITPYWCSRLLLHDGNHKTANSWDIEFKSVENINSVLIDSLLIRFIQYKPFTQNTMTLGYPKSTDESRIIILEHKGIEIREGKPEWGAEPGRLYFVIKHGKRI